jgi:hypothetical protein
MPRFARWGEETSETLYDEPFSDGTGWKASSSMISVQPFADYKAIKKMNASTLVHGLKSMRRLKRYLDGETTTETDAMRLGTAIHCAVLEPQKFPSLYVVMPNFAMDEENVTDKGVRSTSSATKYVKQAQENWRSKNTGRIELDASEYAICNRVFASIQERPDIVAILDASEKEQVFEGEILGVPCKGRIDFIGSILGDLKTTQSVETRAFSRVFFNLEYGFRLAFYRELVRQNRGDMPVSILAVETSGDYDRCLYRVPGELLDYAMESVNITLLKYKMSLETGNWPGVDQGFDGIDFPVPAWAMATAFDWSTVSEESNTEEVCLP